MYTLTEVSKTRFSVVYYSNGCVSGALKQFCLKALADSVGTSGGELVCVTWHPISLDMQAFRNILWPHHEPSHANLYRQILAGVGAARSSQIMLAEHDVLYPAGYHEAMLAELTFGGICYNKNIWCLSARGFFRAAGCDFLSNCGGQREALSQRILAKIEEIERQGYVDWTEPEADSRFQSPSPTVDIRHGQNFTGMRKPPDDIYLSEIDYWGKASRYIQLF